MKILKVRHVEEIAHKMAKFQMDWDEPIPDFGSRYPGKLESCLVQSFQTFAKKDLYPGLVAKATILFYLMIKNHPFVNGNKRIAVATMLTFLMINGKWISIENERLYELSVWVARSDPALKAEVVDFVSALLKRHLVSLK